jgi:uncharacterized paraquat-inducible protein A
MNLSRLPIKDQVAVILTASRAAIKQAYVSVARIGRPRKITPCPRCGVLMTARELHRHSAAQCEEYRRANRAK